MHIDCPHCGPREVEEFEFRSVAPIGAATALERVYERVNLPDESVEHWQHVHGCRAWLVLRRNPSTGAVHSVTWLGGGS